jgi:hypothetical protein
VPRLSLWMANVVPAAHRPLSADDAARSHHAGCERKSQCREPHPDRSPPRGRISSLDESRRQARVPPPRRVVRVGAELCGQWCPDSAGLGFAIATGVAQIPAFQIGFVPTLVASGLAEAAHGSGQASVPWDVASCSHAEPLRFAVCRRLRL